MSDINVQANVFENQLMEPKSFQGIFDLPCGYIDRQGELHKEVQIREMTGVEEDLLANTKIKPSKKMNGLMSACVERIGTITDKGQITRAIQDMLIGDRFFLTFAIRRVSFGDEYWVDETCPSCEKVGSYPVDLSELKSKSMLDPMKRVYEEKLKSGKIVKFHLPTGADELNVASLSDSGDTLTASLLMRVEKINDAKATVESLKNMSSRDRNDLRKLFDKYEGGVDTSIDFVCSDCEKKFKKDLNINTSFFFPSLESNK